MKIFRILIQLINTFTMVLVPRIALYRKEERYEELNKVVSKVFLVICLLALPMIVGIWFTSDYLVPAIYGEEYINSSYVLKILSFILIISPVGYLLGSRMLLITGQENKMILAVGSGAIVNFVCNLVLIRFYNEIGAAIASVAGEMVVMIIYIFLGKRQYKLINIKNTIWKELVSICAMLLFLLVISLLPISRLLITIIQITGSIALYGGLLLLFKEEISINFMKKCIGLVIRRHE